MSFDPKMSFPVFAECIYRALTDSREPDVGKQKQKNFHRAVAKAFLQLGRRKLGEFGDAYNDCKSVPGFACDGGILNPLKTMSEDSAGYNENIAYALAYLAAYEDKYIDQRDQIEKVIAFNESLIEIAERHRERAERKLGVAGEDGAEGAEVECLSSNTSDTDQKTPNLNSKPVRWYASVGALTIVALIAVTASVGTSFRNVSPPIEFELGPSAALLEALEAQKINDTDEYIELLKRASNVGDPIADIALAVAYATGEGRQRDEDIAREFVQAGKSKGFDLYFENNVPEALYYEAMRNWHLPETTQPAVGPSGEIQYLDDIDLEEQFVLLRKSRALGFVRASLQIAHLIFVHQDNNDDCKGLEHAQDALAAGHLTAHYYVYQFLTLTDCPKSDETAAIDHLISASEIGVVEAQIELGEMYHYGYGLPEDLDLAAKWYTEAISKGSIHAEYALGVLLLEAGEQSRNYEQAFRHFRSAAEQGHLGAQNRIGAMYGLGQGVDVDLDKARHWYELAADEGHPVAKQNLAWMLIAGNGVQQNVTKALELFEQVAKIDSSGFKILGDLYRHGEYVPKDKEKAREYYESGVARNNLHARVSLGWTLIDIAPSNYAKAIEHFQVASEGGLPSGMASLGSLYLLGLGVEQSFDKAINNCSLANSVFGDTCVLLAHIIAPREENTLTAAKMRAVEKASLERTMSRAEEGHLASTAVAGLWFWLQGLAAAEHESDVNYLRAETYLTYAAESEADDLMYLLGLFLHFVRDQPLDVESAANKLVGSAAKGGDTGAARLMAHSFLQNGAERITNLYEVFEYLKVLVDADSLSPADAGHLMQEEYDGDLWKETSNNLSELLDDYRSGRGISISVSHGREGLEVFLGKHE